MGQTGQDFLITYLPEVTFATVPGTLTGAKQFPCNASRGMNLGIANIRPEIIRSDGQTGASRGGLKTVTGEFTADLIPGVFDDIIEAGVRGTIDGGGILIPDDPPTKRSFVFEVYEVANGIRRVFLGVRVNTLGFNLTPTGMIQITVGFMGVEQQAPSVAASLFTSPTLFTGKGMVPVDAAISVNGTPRANVTGLEYTLDLHSELVAVAGTQQSPDVFDGNMTGAGTLRAIRSAVADEVAFRNETRYALSMACAATPGGPAVLTMLLPQVRLTSFDAPIGGTGPLIATMGFDIEKEESTVNAMVQYTFA
jgi:hypothetical protein